MRATFSGHWRRRNAVGHAGSCGTKECSKDLNTVVIADTYRIEVAYWINDRGQIRCSGMGRGNKQESTSVVLNVS